MRSLARRVVLVLAASLAGAFFATNEPWLASGKAVCELRARSRRATIASIGATFQLDGHDHRAGVTTKKLLKLLLRTVGAEVIGPAATTSEVEQLISDDIPAAALVEINLRGRERAYGLIDRFHDQGVRVVVSGYRTLPLAPGKAVAVLQKPMKNEQLFAALSNAAR